MVDAIQQSADTLRGGDKGSIILLSAFFGPMIGGAVLFLGSTAVSLATSVAPSGFDWRLLPAAAGMLFLYSAFGIVVGFVPALVSGVAYAYAPTALQRVILSPLFGYGPSLLLFLFAGFKPAAAYALAGAVAALVCASIFRGWGLDRRGAERKLTPLPRP